MPDHRNVPGLECVACQVRPREIGLVCTSCSLAITTSIALLPQQIIDTVVGDSADVLLDQWGRPHTLATCTPIGRDTAPMGIAILDASVSRRHARITRTRGVWHVVDVGSSNGTLVNRQVVTDQVLVHGDQLNFGGVGFCVAFDTQPIRRCPAPAVTTAIRPMTAEQLEANTQCNLANLALRISEPAGGGGGVLELAATTAHLSATQFELVGLLSRRMREDTHLPPSVRGFVRSSELAGALSFDTYYPDDTHVKQLVRRARRTLIRSGIGDVIESRHRFGYRLRLTDHR